MKLLISLFLSILFVFVGLSKSLNICIASSVGASLPEYKVAIYNAARLATEKYNIDVNLTVPKITLKKVSIIVLD